MPIELRVLLVDDEPHVRAHMRAVLAARDGVTVVGEAGDGPAAIEAIDGCSPDLLMLDVQMPGCDGFEVLAAFEPEQRPAVVFVTAFEQYALRAFEAHAIDYLLKPFDDARLVAALDRAATWLGAVGGDRRLPRLLADVAAGRQRQRFVVRERGRVRVVSALDVEWIEARGNYVNLHVPSASFLLRDSLAALERQLDPVRFARVHRSAIVAIDAVVEQRRLPTGALCLRLRSGHEVPLGRSYRSAFEDRWRRE